MEADIRSDSGIAGSPWFAIGRLGTVRISWLLFAASALVYLSNGRTLGSGDTIPARLIPISVVLDGSVMLDRFTAEIARRHPRPYFVVPTRRGLASFYPVATGLVATPILAPAIAYLEWREAPDASRWMDLAPKLEKVAATVIASAAVAVFYALCVALAMAPEVGLLLTACFALGSQAWSTSSQGLWQHGPGCLAILVALWCLARFQPSSRTRYSTMAFAAAGIATAVRPSNFLLVAPFLALAVWRSRARPAALLASIAPLAVIGAAVAGYNQATFGNLGGVYGILLTHRSDTHLTAQLAGLLVSPGRGLLVYFPATLVLLVLLATEPRALRAPFAVASLVGVVLVTLLTATWPTWWGGYSFGPRLLSEAQPLILLALGSGLVASARPRLQRGAIAALLVLLPVQVLIQSFGTFAPPGQLPPGLAWNSDPVSVDVRPERNWDWLDSPIARGLAAFRGD